LKEAYDYWLDQPGNCRCQARLLKKKKKADFKSTGPFYGGSCRKGTFFSVKKTNQQLQS
jgi:hypothetical protein